MFDLFNEKLEPLNRTTILHKVGHFSFGLVCYLIFSYLAHPVLGFMATAIVGGGKEAIDHAHGESTLQNVIDFCITMSGCVAGAVIVHLMH